MKVILINHTANPEKTIACAAKLCYANTTIDKLYDGLTDEKSADFVEMLANIGHESPIEHASFTFGIKGVSRSLLAQITRHRMASFSVQSQRYVKKDGFSFIIPPEIEKNEEAKEIFEEAMKNDMDTYQKLTKVLYNKHYNHYIKEGQSEKQAEQKAEKKAIEDARFILPNACDTQMLVTMNARGLLNFFKLRCCNRAQWEIKAVADEMLKLVLEVAPTLFSSAGPTCYKASCPEGKMTCGQATQVKQFYKNIHKKL